MIEQEEPESLQKTKQKPKQAGRYKPEREPRKYKFALLASEEELDSIKQKYYIVEDIYGKSILGTTTDSEGIFNMLTDELTERQNSEFNTYPWLWLALLGVVAGFGYYWWKKR